MAGGLHVRLGQQLAQQPQTGVEDAAARGVGPEPHRDLRRGGLSLGRWIRWPNARVQSCCLRRLPRSRSRPAREERGAGEEVDQVDLLGPALARGRAGEDGRRRRWARRPRSTWGSWCPRSRPPRRGWGGGDGRNGFLGGVRVGSAGLGGLAPAGAGGVGGGAVLGALGGRAGGVSGRGWAGRVSGRGWRDEDVQARTGRVAGAVRARSAGVLRPRRIAVDGRPGGVGRRGRAGAGVVTARACGVGGGRGASAGALSGCAGGLPGGGRWGRVGGGRAALRGWPRRIVRRGAGWDWPGAGRGVLSRSSKRVSSPGLVVSRSARGVVARPRRVAVAARSEGDAFALARLRCARVVLEDLGSAVVGGDHVGVAGVARHVEDPAGADQVGHVQPGAVRLFLVLVEFVDLGVAAAVAEALLGDLPQALVVAAVGWLDDVHLLDLAARDQGGALGDRRLGAHQRRLHRDEPGWRRTSSAARPRPRP